jgi:hypothetical protein
MIAEQLAPVGHYWPIVLSAFAALLVSYLVSLNIPQKRALARLPIANKFSGFRSTEKSKAAFRQNGAALIAAAEKKVLDYSSSKGHVQG